MKKICAILLFLISSLIMQAQTGIFMQAVQQGLVNNFYAKSKEEVHSAVNYWVTWSKQNEGSYLPDYYAAFMIIQEVGFTENADERDSLADHAMKHIEAAEVLKPNSVEVEVLRGYALWTKMMIDPTVRYMEYSPQITEHCKKAMAMDGENPRAIIFYARDLTLTAQITGEANAEICTLAEESLQLFKQEKHTDHEPHWGQSMAEEVMENCKK